MNNTKINSNPVISQFISLHSYDALPFFKHYILHKHSVNCSPTDAKNPQNTLECLNILFDEFLIFKKLELSSFCRSSPSAIATTL